MKTTLIPIHPVELNGHEIDLFLAIEEEAVQSLVFPVEQLNRVLLASGNATPQVLEAVRRAFCLLVVFAVRPTAVRQRDAVLVAKAEHLPTLPY